MGTSATIIFKNESDEKLFVNRGKDATPEIVLKDINKVIEKKRGCWSGSEMETFVSSFIAILTDPEERLPDYTIAHKPRRDDDYQYYVFYDKTSKEWKTSYGVMPYFEEAKRRLQTQEGIICQKCFVETEFLMHNRYHCKGCENTLVVGDTEWPFTINNRPENLVFKENEVK